MVKTEECDEMLQGLLCLVDVQNEPHVLVVSSGVVVGDSQSFLPFNFACIATTLRVIVVVGPSNRKGQFVLMSGT